MVSFAAFAQQKNKSINYLDRIDSLDIDFDWKKEVFKVWTAIALNFDSVQQMPRENSPYKWDKSKPLVIYLHSADLKFFKDKFILIDSTQLKRKKSVSL